MSQIGTLKDYQKSQSNGIINYTDNGKCSNCGECCGNVLPLTEQDIKAMKGYIKNHNVQPENHTPPVLNQFIDMVCPLRNNRENKCNIYPARPTICRLFKCDKASSGTILDIAKFKGLANLYNVRKLFFGSEGKETLDK